jgi:hypothetical protein
MEMDGPIGRGTVKSGTAKTRAAAMNSAVWLIDKALAPKKNKAGISALRLVTYFESASRQKETALAPAPMRPRKSASIARNYCHVFLF